MSKSPNLSRFFWPILAAVTVVVIGLGFLNSSDESVEATFEARRGPVSIHVIEGGAIEATQAQAIKSRVEGRDGTTILRIIDEGYQVTEADVANELILVELDSSSIVDRIKAQESDVQGALANLMEYVKQKEIRESANLSSIKEASVQAKFALMDFKKYLGAEAAQRILDEIGLDGESIDTRSDGEIASGKSAFEQNLLKAANSVSLEDPNGDVIGGLSGDEAELNGLWADGGQDLLPEINNYDVDFGSFTRGDNEELLGDGEARQELRKLQDALLIAEAEFALRKKTYEGAVRLADRGFLTPNELQNKRIEFDKSRNSLAASRASLELFKTYNIQKEAEQYLLNYEQALMRLSRTKKDAIAEMADSIGDLNRAQRSYHWEKFQLNDLREQYAACTIRAERPGLVVYGDGGDAWDPDEVIREGATVRERQAIITIPDMRHMALKVRIHESHVKRVRKGMPVEITVDAEPDRRLIGTVDNVGVLPDSENRRFNPDQKVYKTSIKIEGIHDWIKPGMAAQAKIIIREIEDTVYVPVQAVFTYQDETVCFVKTAAGPQLRRVEVDDYNNRFTALRSGVKEGDTVFLQTPDGITLNDEYFNERAPKEKPDS